MLDLFATFLALVGAISLWLIWVRRRYVPARRADEIVPVPVGDGHSIVLWRYRPEKKRARYPVILCHGLASNQLTWDLTPRTSVARQLAEEGFDVWVVELRGRWPWAASRRADWDLNAYLYEDVAAAIAQVRRRTRAARVHWMGHSMGGMLLLAHLAEGGDRIQSGVTVGSTLNFGDAPSAFRRMLKLRRGLAYLPALPIGAWSRLWAPLVARLPDNPMERFLWWPDQVDPEHARRMVAGGFHSVPAQVLLQLSTAFEDGLQLASDGANLYEHLSEVTTPVLLVAGDRDAQCRPDAVRLSYERLGSQDKALYVYGPEHGHRGHYGHFDLLIGRDAGREVVPDLIAWLTAHDPNLRETPRS